MSITGLGSGGASGGVGDPSENANPKFELLSEVSAQLEKDKEKLLEEMRHQEAPDPLQSFNETLEKFTRDIHTHLVGNPRIQEAVRNGKLSNDDLDTYAQQWESRQQMRFVDAVQDKLTIKHLSPIELGQHSNNISTTTPASKPKKNTLDTILESLKATVGPDFLTGLAQLKSEGKGATVIFQYVSNNLGNISGNEAKSSSGPVVSEGWTPSTPNSYQSAYAEATNWIKNTQAGSSENALAKLYQGSVGYIQNNEHQSWANTQVLMQYWAYAYETGQTSIKGIIPFSQLSQKAQSDLETISGISPGQTPPAITSQSDWENIQPTLELFYNNGTAGEKAYIQGMSLNASGQWSDSVAIPSNPAFVKTIQAITNGALPPSAGGWPPAMPSTNMTDIQNYLTQWQSHGGSKELIETLEAEMGVIEKDVPDNAALQFQLLTQYGNQLLKGGINIDLTDQERTYLNVILNPKATLSPVSVGSNDINAALEEMSKWGYSSNFLSDLKSITFNHPNESGTEFYQSLTNAWSSLQTSFQSASPALKAFISSMLNGAPLPPNNIPSNTNRQVISLEKSVRDIAQAYPENPVSSASGQMHALMENLGAEIQTIATANPGMSYAEILTQVQSWFKGEIASGIQTDWANGDLTKIYNTLLPEDQQTLTTLFSTPPGGVTPTAPPPSGQWSTLLTALTGDYNTASGAYKTFLGSMITEVKSLEGGPYAAGLTTLQSWYKGQIDTSGPKDFFMENGILQYNLGSSSELTPDFKAFQNVWSELFGSTSNMPMPTPADNLYNAVTAARYTGNYPADKDIFGQIRAYLTSSSIDVETGWKGGTGSLVGFYNGCDAAGKGIMEAVLGGPPGSDPTVWPPTSPGTSFEQFYQMLQSWPDSQNSDAAKALLQAADNLQGAQNIPPQMKYDLMVYYASSIESLPVTSAGDRSNLAKIFGTNPELQNFHASGSQFEQISSFITGGGIPPISSYLPSQNFGNQGPYEAQVLLLNYYASPGANQPSAPLMALLNAMCGGGLEKPSSTSVPTTTSQLFNNLLWYAQDNMQQDGGFTFQQDLADFMSAHASDSFSQLQSALKSCYTSSTGKFKFPDEAYSFSIPQAAFNQLLGL